MREIKYIVVHCTAGPQRQSTDNIKAWWKSLGWINPGYHYLIDADGYEEELQHESKPTNGVAGYNANAIHVCYKGGVDANGKPLDNRTQKQKDALRSRLHALKTRYPKAVIVGHRDFPNVAKACPSFDAKNEYKDLCR